MRLRSGTVAVRVHQSRAFAVLVADRVAFADQVGFGFDVSLIQTLLSILSIVDCEVRIRSLLMICLAELLHTLLRRQLLSLRLLLGAWDFGLNVGFLGEVQVMVASFVEDLVYAHDLGLLLVVDGAGLTPRVGRLIRHRVVLHQVFRLHFAVDRC